MFGKPAVKNDSLWGDICNLMFGRKVYRRPRLPWKCDTCKDSGFVYDVNGSLTQDEPVPCPKCTLA